MQIPLCCCDVFKSIDKVLTSSCAGRHHSPSPQPSLVPQVGKIQCPVFIMHGTDDGVVPCENGRLPVLGCCRTS